MRNPPYPPLACIGVKSFKGFKASNRLGQRLARYGQVSAALFFVAYFALLEWFPPMGPAPGVMALLQLSWPWDYGLNAFIAQTIPVPLTIITVALEARVSSVDRDFREQYLDAFDAPNATDVCKMVLASMSMLCACVFAAVALFDERNATGRSALVANSIGSAVYLASLMYVGIATLLHPIWYITYKKA